MRKTNDFKKEYKLMLDTWGKESQINMCIEEMAELTKALCKYKRLQKFDEKDVEKINSNLENIKEEVADVLNTVEQLLYMFGCDEINDIRKQKVSRAMKKIISV